MLCIFERVKMFLVRILFVCFFGTNWPNKRNNKKKYIYIYILVIYTKEIDFERRRCHPENVQTFLTGGESLRKRDFFFVLFFFYVEDHSQVR